MVLILVRREYVWAANLCEENEVLEEKGEMPDDKTSSLYVDVAGYFPEFSGYVLELSGAADIAELETHLFPYVVCSAYSLSQTMPATIPLTLGPPRHRRQNIVVKKRFKPVSRRHGGLRRSHRHRHGCNLGREGTTEWNPAARDRIGAAAPAAVPGQGG